MEIADRKVWVRASREILEELRKGWSRPICAHAEENADGSWEMTFRAYYNERGEIVAPPFEAKPVGEVWP